MNKARLVFVAVTALFIIAPPSARAQSPGSGKKSITDIPLRPHDREVDLFFDDEKPKEPYYMVKIAELQAAPGTSMDAMLVLLKSLAQAQGLDGVMIGDPVRQAGKVVTFAGSGGFTSYLELAGIGIRYRRTIDYMDTILMQQSVSVWSKDNTDPKRFDMKYDFYGNNLSLGDPYVNDFFDRQVFPFEDAASPVAPFAGWECKYDESDNVFTKKKTEVNYTVYTSRFYYENNKWTKAELVSSPSNEFKRTKSQLDPVYNTGGLLIGRRLTTGKNIEWEESISYRLNGMPDKIQRYKMVDGQKVILFEIKNSYYSEAALPAPRQ